MTSLLTQKKNKPEDQIIYNTIYHRARKRLGLDVLEFCIADTIYHLAANPSSPTPGWCHQSKATLAKNLGMCERAIYNSLKKLIRLGLVERGTMSQLLRTTSKWYDEVMIDKQSLEDDRRTAKSADRLQEMQSSSAKSADRGYAKSADKNNSYKNNIKNLKDNNGFFQKQKFNTPVFKTDVYELRRKYKNNETLVKQHLIGEGYAEVEIDKALGRF